MKLFISEITRFLDESSSTGIIGIFDSEEKAFYCLKQFFQKETENLDYDSLFNLESYEKDKEGFLRKLSYVFEEKKTNSSDHTQSYFHIMTHTLNKLL